MSLDIYLHSDTPVRQVPGSGIFIRTDGQTKEISREEWDELHPGAEPIAFNHDPEGPVTTTCVFHSNITHNLAKMASKALLYMALWKPEEVDIKRAKQLIKPLSDGLALLKGDPSLFTVMNPENGWGSYDGLVRFVETYLAMCKRWPEARVEASR